MRSTSSWSNSRGLTLPSKGPMPAPEVSQKIFDTTSKMRISFSTRRQKLLIAHFVNEVNHPCGRRHGARPPCLSRKGSRDAAHSHLPARRKAGSLSAGDLPPPVPRDARRGGGARNTPAH